VHSEADEIVKEGFYTLEANLDEVFSILLNFLFAVLTEQLALTEHTHNLFLLKLL